MSKSKLLARLFVLVLAVQLVAVCFTGCTTNQMLKVSIVPAQNGSVTASASEVAPGGHVVFTVTPDDGYILSSFKINGVESEVFEDTCALYLIEQSVEVTAAFSHAQASVTFDDQLDGAYPDLTVTYGKAYGALPTAHRLGWAFVGWSLDKDGKRFVAANTVVSIMGNHTLYAVFEEITAAYKAGLVPHTATLTFFDASAEAYGVTFHTANAAAAPVIQVVEGAAGDFAAARNIECTRKNWERQYLYKGVIDGLAFDAEYTYRVGDLESGIFSPAATFKTRQEEPLDTKFIYVTDTQSTHLNAYEPNPAKDSSDPDYIGVAHNAWKTVMDDAYDRFDRFDFMAHGGDIVNYGDSMRYWKEMLDDVQAYAMQLPMMLTAGNHDDPGYYSNGVWHLQQNMYNIDLPAQDAGRGFYLSFDYGPMHFVILNSNDVFRGSTGTYTDAQLSWLAKDIEAAKNNDKIKWTIAMHHEGIIRPTKSAIVSNDHQDTTRPQLMPILRDLEIDLVLYGHNHYLNSTYPLEYDSGSPELVRIVTKNTSKLTYDGDMIDAFDTGYVSGRDGTVFHQTGTAGRQYNNSFHVSELEMHLQERVFYRNLRGGGNGTTFNDGKNYSMYSYVEVSEDSLIMRTYGVSVDMYDGDRPDPGRFIDGFALYK